MYSRYTFLLSLIISCFVGILIFWLATKLFKLENQKFKTSLIIVPSFFIIFIAYFYLYMNFFYKLIPSPWTQTAKTLNLFMWIFMLIFNIVTDTYLIKKLYNINWKKAFSLFFITLAGVIITYILVIFTIYYIPDVSKHESSKEEREKELSNLPVNISTTCEIDKKILKWECIESTKKAEDFYQKAKYYYTDGNYIESVKYARDAKDVYKKLNNSEGVEICNKLIELNNKQLKNIK